MAGVDGMTEPQVRVATAEDGPAILRIDRDGFSPVHSPGRAPAEDADPFAHHDPDDVLVAEVDGAVIGYLTLGHPTPLASNTHVWQVQALAVHPDARRHGAARALLRAGIDEARRRGGRRLTLRVLGGNEPAQRLYASEGFEVEGVQRGEFVLDGQEVDDVMMARRLD